MEEREILSKIKATGVSEHDAKVIADCIVTKRSCSWVNTDPVKRESVRSLLEFLKANDFRLGLSIKEVPNRNKYIWEVKVPQEAKK